MLLLYDLQQSLMWARGADIILMMMYVEISWPNAQVIWWCGMARYMILVPSYYSSNHFDYVVLWWYHAFGDIVAWMLKGAKSIFLDAAERLFWRLVHFWSILTIFRFFFVHSERQLLGAQPGVPCHFKPPRTRLVTLWPDMSTGLSVEDT